MRGPERSNNRPTKGDASPPASADSEYTETTCARSQPKLSEIGLRNTVKLSPRPRPSTESMKHRASTLSAVRVGLGGARKPSRGVFSSMPVRGRVSAFSSKGLNRMLLCRLEQDVALSAER